MSAQNLKKLFTATFEISGKVQGVYFRKYTENFAKGLGIRGWVMNTSHGTVKGQMEGNEKQLVEMKKWLTETGSPKSQIENASFSDLAQIRQFTFKSFVVKH
ncbi:acylphosphatase-2-like [Teleopsis dalmanni]|uniref:acylphosphatase-2-like n=1 Tax=Teleopsis dalmanni TaxID=139649 RepID=UPI0018CFCB25|nr:acylphosphatase-2-like [Teleopsis dalmanni]